MFEMFSWGSGIVSSVNLNSFVIALDLSGAAVRADDLHDALALSSNVLVQVTGLEAECTWLIVIDNAHGGFAVGAFKLLFGIRVVQLKVKVLIGLPVIVVEDVNSNFLEGFVVVKLQDLINRFIIFSGLGVAIYGTNTDFAGFLSLINNFNANVLGSLTD